MKAVRVHLALDDEKESDEALVRQLLWTDTVARHKDADAAFYARRLRDGFLMVEQEK